MGAKGLVKISPFLKKIQKQTSSVVRYFYVDTFKEVNVIFLFDSKHNSSFKKIRNETDTVTNLQCGT